MKMASAAGVAPATSTFAEWRSVYLSYADKMASVVGLAPTRFGLKGRSRGLLCIHGQKMVPKVGIAPTSLRLQRSANLPQLLGESGPSAW